MISLMTTSLAESSTRDSSGTAATASRNLTARDRRGAYLGIIAGFLLMCHACRAHDELECRNLQIGGRRLKAARFRCLQFRRGNLGQGAKPNSPPTTRPLIVTAYNAQREELTR